MHSGRIEIGPVGPDHYPQLQARLLEKGRILQRFVMPQSRAFNIAERSATPFVPS
jgi:hypothetical protein